MDAIRSGVDGSPPPPRAAHGMVRQIENKAVVNKAAGGVRFGKRGRTAPMKIPHAFVPARAGNGGIRTQDLPAVVVHLEQDPEAFAFGHRGAEQRPQVIVASGQLRGVPQLRARKRKFKTKTITAVPKHDRVIPDGPIWQFAGEIAG